MQIQDPSIEILNGAPELSCFKLQHVYFLFEGYTYHLDSSTIFPTSSKKKNSEKEGKNEKEATRNMKSPALSKLDELYQIASVKTSKNVTTYRADPRVILTYWYTSTVTSTFTTITATTTFSLTICTPGGTFSYSACV